MCSPESFIASTMKFTLQPSVGAGLFNDIIIVEVVLQFLVDRPRKVKNLYPPAHSMKEEEVGNDKSRN
jgi:hypothetical protein